MKKIFFVPGLVIAFGSLLAVNAFAQTKPDVLVKQRQAAMTLQGKYFGPLGGMAAGRVPYDAAVVARNAGYLEVISKMPWDGFDASTSGEKSNALPEVFSNTAKFKQAADNLQTEIGKLATVSKGGNEADTKAAIGAVGKACGACHDDFRVKPK
ncbi:MAG TPA: cytochrome c [Ramlibacter sp.]|nr:cytochrome c [Ramlibacter sp.]